MPRNPVVRMVRQRHDADCAVAALSMCLGVSYEAALLALNDPRVLHGGTWLTQMVTAASQFDVCLRKITRWSPLTHEGIARVKLKRRPHVVVIRCALLFDTDGAVWAPDDYLLEHRATFGTLLEHVQ